MKQLLITMSALVAVTALGCSNSNDPSSSGSQPDAGENVLMSAEEFACEQLAFVRENWNIDSPRPGWPADLAAAARSAEDGLTPQQVEQLRTAVGDLTNTDPDVEVDIIAQGDAQRAVNAYSKELCGFEVF